jgi:hypothetical protein
MGECLCRLRGKRREVVRDFYFPIRCVKNTGLWSGIGDDSGDVSLRSHS